MIFITAKDWLQDWQKVMERIVKRLKELPVLAKENVEKIITIPQAEVASPEIISGQGEAALFIELEKKVIPIVQAYDYLDFKRLTFIDPVSNKFWEAAIESNKLIVRLGELVPKAKHKLKRLQTKHPPKRKRTS